MVSSALPVALQSRLSVARKFIQSYNFAAGFDMYVVLSLKLTESWHFIVKPF